MNTLKHAISINRPFIWVGALAVIGSTWAAGCGREAVAQDVPSRETPTSADSGVGTRAPQPSDDDHPAQHALSAGQLPAGRPAYHAVSQSNSITQPSSCGQVQRRCVSLPTHPLLPLQKSIPKLLDATCAKVAILDLARLDAISKYVRASWTVVFQRSRLLLIASLRRARRCCSLLPNPRRGSRPQSRLPQRRRYWFRSSPCAPVGFTAGQHCESQSLRRPAARVGWTIMVTVTEPILPSVASGRRTRSRCSFS